MTSLEHSPTPFHETAYYKNHILRYNIERTKRFVEFTIENNKPENREEAIQSVSNLILDCIMDLNRLGFFTVDSGEGICMGTYDETKDASPYVMFPLKEGESPWFYQKRAYISGVIPRSIFEMIRKPIMDKGYNIYDVTYGPSDTEVVLDREIYIDEQDRKELGYISAIKSAIDPEVQDEFEEFVYRIEYHEPKLLGPKVKGIPTHKITRDKFVAVHIVDPKWCRNTPNNVHLFNDVRDILAHALHSNGGNRPSEGTRRKRTSKRNKKRTSNRSKKH